MSALCPEETFAPSEVQRQVTEWSGHSWPLSPDSRSASTPFGCVAAIGGNDWSAVVALIHLTGAIPHSATPSGKWIASKPFCLSRSTASLAIRQYGPRQ